MNLCRFVYKLQSSQRKAEVVSVYNIAHFICVLHINIFYFTLYLDLLCDRSGLPIFHVFSIKKRKLVFLCTGMICQHFHQHSLLTIKY